MFGDPETNANSFENVSARMEATRRHTAAIGGFAPSGDAVQMATGRPRDPMFYWRQNNIPFDFTKPEELKKIREFCSDPAELVWMGDYTFKPIGEIQAGDEVIAWTKPTAGQKSRLVRSEVLATSRRVAPETVKITTETGRTWTGTPDHKFANPYYSPGQTSGNRGWQQPEFIHPEVGKQLRHIIDPTEPLTSDKERETAAWLGGIYDGEGCGEGIGQSVTHNPDVYARIQNSLDFLGLPHVDGQESIFIRAANSRKPAKKPLVDLLNWGGVTRRKTNAIDKRMLTRISGSKDRIVSVEPLGPGEVVSMQTTEGTYIVSGFASSNCRLLYMTHPVIAACVDIYSKLPLQGMHVECKDEQLVEFYTDLFFDQLKLEDHLVRMGRQYWLSGEIFSLGMWNENLGVWDDEQIISPDNVEVESSLFINKPRFMMRLPDNVHEVLTERQPVWEYQQLVSEYPELLQFAKDDELMPVSNYIMFQMRFEGDDFSNRGISILMRAFRTIIQEEMLMTALDSIADRLYTPMIVAKLGASATDLGTETPWIPTPEQKVEFNQSIDAALSGDFRVLTTNFATNIETVFGRENVPDLSNDFDRITERILMSFGLSQTMLTGASAGETYAADALNRDVVTQLLTHYQRKLQDYFYERAAIVAEAQEHFDYEVRNGERYLVTEDIWEIDEETGEETLFEQPKLLVPELKFKILNLTDESEMSEFIEGLAMDGQIPIPIRERIKRTGIDFDEMIEVKTQETIQLAVAEQRVRKELYATLLAEGLPIPDDLIKDFRPQAQQADAQQLPPGASDVSVSSLGQGPQDLPVLAPTEDDLEGNQQAAEDQMLNDQQNDSTAPDLPQPGDDVPPESTEQMGRMPKPASLRPKVSSRYSIWQSMSADERKQLVASLKEQLQLGDEDIKPKKLRTKAVRKLGIRDATEQHHIPVDNSQEKKLEHYRPTGKFGMPRHVGMRRYLDVPDELNLRKKEVDDSET